MLHHSEIKKSNIMVRVAVDAARKLEEIEIYIRSPLYDRDVVIRPHDLHKDVSNR